MGDDVLQLVGSVDDAICGGICRANVQEALTVPFATLPMNLYIHGPRYAVMFDRISMPRLRLNPKRFGRRGATRATVSPVDSVAADVTGSTLRYILPPIPCDAELLAPGADGPEVVS